MEKGVIKYRKDIDGLRALAVMSVVLYHLFPIIIQGGFMGVDIFFVISGYLISSIIFKNLEANNFSIYDFYAKRIKRIFPALILVITSCLVAGWFIMNSIEYVQLSKHAKASSYFYTNFILVKEAGYFDVDSHYKPLMHLWSLAVEEQFYVFWPLVLYFANKKNFNPLSIIVLIILISFAINVKMVHKNSTVAYWLTISRVWELIVGSGLAYFASTKINRVERFVQILEKWINVIVYKNCSAYNRKTLINAASIFGFGIILYCIIFPGKVNLFPGWKALFPVVGTVLILLVGEEAWVNKQILSSKLFVNIGLISYPLYLWHWPLLCFAFIIEGQMPEGNIMWAIFFISLILAWLTYRFVEQPIRLSKDKKYIVLILTVLLVSVGVLSNQILKKEGYPSRASSIMASISRTADQDENFMQSLLIYDPTNLFCNEKKCYGKKNDIIYYADDDHLNLEGSKILVDDFKKWFSELDKAN
jgi:hypothetical protein